MENTCLNNLKIKEEENIKNIESELATLKKTLTEYKSLKSKIDETKKSIEEIKNYNSDIQREKSINESSIISEENMIDSLKKQIEEFNDMKDDSLKLVEHNYNNKVELESVSFDTELVNLKTQIESLTSNIKDCETDNNSYNDKLKELKSLIVDVDENSNSQLEVLKSKLFNDISNYESINSVNESNKEYNKKLEEQIEKNKERLKEIKDLKLKNVKDLTEWNTTKEHLLKKYPLWLVEYQSKDLSNKMNEIINMIYHKPLNVSFKVDKNSLKLNYGTSERKLPTTRLSGAESTIVDLSFLTVFNKMLKLGFIALDEVDAFFDDKNKESFYNAILEFSKLYPQVLIITHSEEMKKYLQINANCNTIQM